MVGREPTEHLPCQSCRLWGSTDGQMTRALYEYRGFRYSFCWLGWFSQDQSECVVSFTLHRDLQVCAVKGPGGWLVAA